MKRPTERQRRLAEGVILEGKSFRQSALDVGYSESTANKGAAVYTKGRPGLQSAFITVANEAMLDTETVKNVAKYRLFDDVVKAKDSGVTRQIELLGRMKEHDWFVRNTDVQIGVFASLADNEKLVSSVESLSSELPEESKE